jgi:hypothetical protein
LSLLLARYINSKRIKHIREDETVKRLLQSISALILGLALSTAAVSADTVTCGSISNTGANSTNTVSCVDQNSNSVSCVNSEVAESTNNQTASSGGAFTTANTNSGGATSGSSSNNNTVTVSLGASCNPVQAAVSTANGTPATSTPANSKPAATNAATPTAAQTAAPVSLPGTGSNTSTYVALGSLAGFVVLLVGSRLGLAAFRRYNNHR